MPAAQTLLFPDPQPLVERLGREFFRTLPEKAGVYLMRGADEAVLYVGKAKNLRKRLGSYRVANPERLPRRHLRLLRAVVRIEFEECADEVSALAREAELLRTLKPRFNRAGTWRPPPRFFVWRSEFARLEIAVTESPEAGWRAHGPLGSGALVLRAVLARLLWAAAYPERGIAELPLGWGHGEFEGNIIVFEYPGTSEMAGAMVALFGGRMAAFGDWVRSKQRVGAPAFEQAAVTSDLEWLEEFPSLSRLCTEADVR
jgi:predicted GIY-YIG superfamily endonuclease